MIEDGNLFDLRQQALINLRHIRPWQRPGLTQQCHGQPAKRKHTEPDLQVAIAILITLQGIANLRIEQDLRNFNSKTSGNS